MTQNYHICYDCQCADSTPSTRTSEAIIDPDIEAGWAEDCVDQIFQLGAVDIKEFISSSASHFSVLAIGS